MTNEALKLINANTYTPVYVNIKNISRKLVDSTKYVVVNDPYMPSLIDNIVFFFYHWIGECNGEHGSVHVQTCFLIEKLDTPRCPPHTHWQQRRHSDTDIL